MRYFFSQRGQGLLETVIAIGVLAAGTIGTITLITATVSSGRATHHTVIAASLAREGIEMVRSVRDTNWLRIEANEAGVVDTFSGGAGAGDDIWSTNKRHGTIPVLGVSATDNTITLSKPANNLDFTTTCGGSTSCSQVFFDTAAVAGVYRQRTAGAIPATLQTTPYFRIVTTQPICRKDGLNAASADGIPDIDPVLEEFIETDNRQDCNDGPPLGFANYYMMVGINVTSRVEWDEGRKNLVLSERLYNWKYVK